MKFASGETITIPSPIDVHMHLREPGGTDKETIATGTYAALAGGYQAVFDMPNNPGRPTWTEERLDEKAAIADRDAYTDIGFYAGVDLENPSLDQLRRMFGKVAGLKLYMGHTTGNQREHNLDSARPVIDSWLEQADQTGARPPILLHAQGAAGAETAEYIAYQNHPVHWCHVSTLPEVNDCGRLTRRFPDNFSAGVTPHHLTMTERDADFKYGWNGGRMMPRLGSQTDSDALLSAFNGGTIQILETDHAPHTSADKLRAEAANPEGHDDIDCVTCFGVSGIEFVLPVMMSLVQRRKIAMQRLVDSLHTQPIKMLGLQRGSCDAQTTLNIAPYVIGEDDRLSMGANTPYVGWTGWARVEKVDVAGQTRFWHRSAKYELMAQARILKTGDFI